MVGLAGNHHCVSEARFHLRIAPNGQPLPETIMATYNGNGGKNPTILFVHGLWLTPRSWSGWVQRYEKAGCTVLAPSWPGLEGEVEAVRRDPTPLKGLRIKTVVDHYERIIRRLDRPPILMGHSFGGLMVQLLVDRGLAAAGVLLGSAQTAGIPVLPLVTIRATLPVFGNPFTYNAAVPLTPKQFNYAFTNELDAVASRRVYDELHIPGAAHILWQGGFALLNPNAESKVDYRNGRRAPLLFIAGDKDHLSPPAISKANVRKYAGSGAVTEYKEYRGRTHHTVGQEGWEEVADFALAWAREHALSSEGMPKSNGTTEMARRDAAVAI
jgi:pimeloyl-ACP methyl ester carboxylesterase